MGYGHYMLSAERRPIGSASYELGALHWTDYGRELTILPPPTPLWHWAVW